MARLALFIAAGVLALMAVVPASASTQPAAGTFTQGPETLTGAPQVADGNLIVELTREVVFTGTFTGVGQAEERIVIHKDGSTNVQGTIVFTGVACGQPVVLEFLLVGQGQLDENFETGTIAGIWTIIDSGQSETRTIRGHGTFEGAAGGGGTYEGEVHCEEGAL